MIHSLSRITNILALQLPKHKSVVVTLNDSDDSESDGEASKSTNSVFGGLESMIKEARRTAEVIKCSNERWKDLVPLSGCIQDRCPKDSGENHAWTQDLSEVS